MKKKDDMKYIVWNTNLGVADIVAKVEESLPRLVDAVKWARKEREVKPVIIMHQDAYAADLQMNELFLLGAAIKYIGQYGIEVRIVGKNRETVDTVK